MVWQYQIALPWLDKSNFILLNLSVFLATDIVFVTHAQDNEYKKYYVVIEIKTQNNIWLFLFVSIQLGINMNK